jgi:hypothetical protein
MRPTNLGFRSPREKTAEFRHPVVTFDGRVLPLLQTAPRPTFSRSRRFSQYDMQANKNRPGPGSYNVIYKQTPEWNIKGTPVYKQMHRSKDTSDNGYFYFGDSVVYEPSFVKKKNYSSQPGTSNQIKRAGSNKDNDTSIESEILTNNITSISANTPKENKLKSPILKKIRIQKRISSQFNNSPYATSKIVNLIND